MTSQNKKIRPIGSQKSQKKTSMSSFQVIALGILGLMALAVLVAVGVAMTYITKGQPELAPVEPVSTQAPLPTPTVTFFEFEGDGDDVVVFTSDREGLALFGMGHYGDGNFIVTLYQSDGTYVDLLVAEGGDYKGRKTVFINRGEHVINVRADGSWFLIVGPPQ